MPDDNGDKWSLLKKPNFNSKKIAKRMRRAEGVTIRHAHKFVIKRWDNVREVQRHIVTWILIIGVLIAAAGLQLVWNQQSYETTSPVKDGIYAEAILGSIDSLNPLYSVSAAEQSVNYLLFSRLLKYDTTGHLSYDLAKNITINDKQTVYTVAIRSDVKWHDGKKLTADDIAFTINLMKDPNVRAMGSGWDGITVKVIDSQTIEFTLRSPFAAFEHALTFAILPEHILGQVAPISIRESVYSKNPIGSGPFKLSFVQNIDNVQSGKKVIFMTRNDEYYGGKVGLARFQLHLYNSADLIIKALSQNEVNSAVGLSESDLSRINDKRYEVITKPIQTGVYALFNTKSQFLKETYLRRALQRGIDTTEIRKELPIGTPRLDLPLTNHQIAGDLPKATDFNTIEAKKILEDNGWKLNAKNIREKDGTELKLSVVAIKNSELERVLEVIAGQLRSLGISVDTKVIDLTDTSQGEAQNILQQRSYDVLIYQLNLGADPDVYAYWSSSQVTSMGLNFANYSNSISDDALLSGRARIEKDLRNAKYVTFAKQWLNDVPAVGLYQSTMEYVTSRSSRSFNRSNTLISPVDRYSDILDWSVGTHNVYKSP